LARFRDSHSGVPGEKNHLDVGSVERCRVYYKGEGGGFPQVRAMVSLVCPCCPWLILAPKVLQLCTNHFVWVVCRPVWVNEACQLFLVPSWSSNTPLYPSKCCELGSVPQLLPLLLSCTWTHFLVLQRVGSASIWKPPKIVRIGATNMGMVFLQLSEKVHLYIRVVPNSKSSKDMKCGQTIKGL